MLIRCNADFLKLEAGGELHIYGAKSVAAQVHAVLKRQGTAVAGFLVTDSGTNPEEIDGLPVRCVYDVSEKRRGMSIVLGVLPRFKKSVMNLLLNLGFYNVVLLDDAYADELKRRAVACGIVTGTDYGISFPDEIERNQGYLFRKGAEQNILRIGTAALASGVRDASHPLLRGSGFLGEFESLWGTYRRLKPCAAVENELQAAEGRFSLYSIRCHIDKRIGGAGANPMLKPLQAGAALTRERVCELVDYTNEPGGDFRTECGVLRVHGHILDMEARLRRRRLRGLLPLPPLHTGVRRKARQHSGAGS